MAAVDFKTKILAGYRALVAEQWVIDGSRQRSAATTEDTAKTERAAQFVVDTIEDQLGPVGPYDDSNDTIGYRGALSLALEMMPIAVFNKFSLTKKADSAEGWRELLQRLEMMRETLAEEASDPVVSDPPVPRSDAGSSRGFLPLGF